MSDGRPTPDDAEGPRGGCLLLCGALLAVVVVPLMFGAVSPDSGFRYFVLLGYAGSSAMMLWLYARDLATRRIDGDTQVRGARNLRIGLTSLFAFGAFPLAMLEFARLDLYVFAILLNLGLFAISLGVYGAGVRNFPRRSDAGEAEPAPLLREPAGSPIVQVLAWAGVAVYAIGPFILHKFVGWNREQREEVFLAFVLGVGLVLLARFVHLRHTATRSALNVSLRRRLRFEWWILGLSFLAATAWFHFGEHDRQSTVAYSALYYVFFLICVMSFGARENKRREADRARVQSALSDTFQ